METARASLPERLKAAERSLREQRAGLFEAVRQDPDFQREHITLYEFDSLENIDLILALLDKEAATRLDQTSNRTMIDIGCANGDLGFAFEEAGFSVALLDKGHVAERDGSLVLQNAPLVASIIARNRGSRVAIIDEDIDDGFDPRRVIEGFSRARPDDEPFDRFGLGVMVGVLYHLRNPYSAMEKLTQLCDHLVVGTWVADCMPDRRRSIKDDQLAFLLESGQLAADPSNFWIFTPRSFRVLAERCGWQVLATHSVTNSPPGAPPPSLARKVRNRLERWLPLPQRQPGVSPPDDVRQRVFMLLKRRT
jgi:tRNA (mo5U34)-methyltransferase